MFGKTVDKNNNDKNIIRNENPLAAAFEDNEVILTPFDNLFGRDEDGNFIFVENIEDALGHFAFVPGLQVFASGGNPRFGEISDRGATGPNRPSRIYVGSWVIMMPITILDRTVTTVTFGMVGERTVMTSNGPSFTATRPMNARRVDELVSDIAQQLLYHAIGCAMPEESIVCDIDGIQSVIDNLKVYGLPTYSDGTPKAQDDIAIGWNQLRLGLSGENKNVTEGPSRLSVRHGSKELTKSKSSGKTGSGVNADQALADAEAALAAAGG